MLMNYLEINLKKCTVFLTEKEMQTLLCKDIELYKIGLKRGKAIMRSEKQRRRELNKYH